MRLGTLDFEPVESMLDIVGEPTKQAIQTNKLPGVLATKIDPKLSDTAAFCEQYGIELHVSVNCVIIEAKRADRTWYAACMIPANARADINGIVRRHLNARKISFAPIDTAVHLSQMEYGGISPIGLPADWPILVDAQAAALPYAIIGSGIRDSKLLIPGSLLANLPNAVVLAVTK